MRYLCLILFAAGCYHANQNGESPLVSIQIQDRNGLTETISIPERLEAFQATDFLASQPYKKILRVYRKDKKMAAKITTYHPNGHVAQYLESQDMRAFGAYREWHSNGVQKIEANVIGGPADVVPDAQREWLFDQLATIWDEQGQLQATISYEKGNLHGPYLTYFPSGGVQRRSPYLGNLLEGQSIDYFSDGKLLATTTYRKGLKHGPSSGFWPHGGMCWQEEYQDGLLLSGQYITKEGRIIAEVLGGFGYQALFKDELLDRTVEYRRGQPNGAIKIYWPNGELKTQYHIKNGRKQGDETEYFAAVERLDEGSKEPLPKALIPWESNLITGVVKTWYSHGKLQSQRDMSRNKKSGSSIAWYRDGSLMLLEHYEDDKLLSGQYYKRGLRDSVSSIVNGTGTAMLYDENGAFLRKVQYLKSKPVDPD